MLKYITIFVLSFFFANAALADWTDYPSLYDVVGVEVDDVLNVRKNPSPSAPIINTLAPNQRDVEIVAVSNDERWGLVGFPDGSGWVSMRYMARQPRQDPQFLPKPLGCGGNEPFWSLDINNHTAQFDIVGEERRTFAPVWEDIPEGMLPVSYAVKLQGNAEDITAVVRRAQCSDGMSEEIYGFSVDLIISGSYGTYFYTGCCSQN